MTGGEKQDAGVRMMRWATTVLVGTAVGFVTVRVIGCIGDAACTFAPGALQTAVFAFVGGPLLIGAVWLVPALQRRGVPAAESPAFAGVLMAAGCVVMASGIWTMAGGGPAGAVLPAFGPGLVMAGVLVWLGGGSEDG